MKKIIIYIVLALVLIGLLFTGYLWFSEQMLVRLPVLVQEDPKITFVMGNSFYKNSENAKWELAIVGTKLKMNSSVKTDKDSLMDIRFHDNMAIRITENSILKIDDHTIKKLTLYVQKGSMYGKFEKLYKNYDINIKTLTTTAGVRGTELGFEITEIEKDKKSRRKKKKKKEDSDESNTLPVTTVYSLSGITELSNPNPEFKDQKVLLSFQNKVVIKKDAPPSNPEKLTEKEVNKISTVLNSIHTQEVLLISEKINFKIGSAKILKSSYEELDKIVAILKKKSVDVRIEGHTDSQASASINQALSIKRADSIRNYLVSKEIDHQRLKISGYGETKPVASNKTKKGRAMNRRVEFIIIDD